MCDRTRLKLYPNIDTCMSFRNIKLETICASTETLVDRQLFTRLRFERFEGCFSIA